MFGWLDPNELSIDKESAKNKATHGTIQIG